MKMTELENHGWAISFGMNVESQWSPYAAEEECASFRMFGAM